MNVNKLCVVLASFFLFALCSSTVFAAATDNIAGEWNTGSVRTVINSTETIVQAQLYITIVGERTISGSFFLARPGSPAITFSGVVGWQRYGDQTNGYYNDMLLKTSDGKTLIGKYWNTAQVIEIYAYGTTETGDNSADFYIFRR